MNSNTFKTTKDFLNSIIARKAPHLYLPEARFMPTQKNSINGILNQILTSIAVPIPSPLTDLYDQLGLSRSKGSKLIKKLVASGYIIEHQFHPSRRGGFIKLLELTKTGWSILNASGIKQPLKVLQGSWEHDLCGKVLGAIGKREQYKVLYEVLIGQNKNFRVDVLWQTKTGKQIFFQCGISSAEREAESILKAIELPIVQQGKLVLICRDKSFANKVSGLLKKKDLNYPLNLKLLGDVLENYYTKKHLL